MPFLYKPVLIFTILLLRCGLVFCQDSIHTSSFFIIKDLTIRGNKTTHLPIIQRELPFSNGDTVAAEKLSKLLRTAHDNLMNTSLFNFVTIDTLSDGDKLNIQIDLKERWYLWPFPIFEISDRNFNAWWEKKDFSRINYGMYLVQENFRGRKESIKLLLRFGFDQKFSLVYLKPWLNKSQTLGLGFGIGYSRNHTVAYLTDNNHLCYFKSKHSYPNQSYYIGASLTCRKGLYTTHSLAAYFDSYQFSDTLLHLNPSFAPSARTQYFTLSYTFQNDRRDYKTYPLKGHFISIILEKKGLGLFKTETLDLLNLKISLRKYWNIYPRFFLSCAFFGKVGSSSSKAYFAEQGLGYGSETVRSFEYYVIDGANYGLIKTQLKYQLVKTKIIHLKFLPLSKFNTIPISFYINLFYDGGYITKYSINSTDKLANRYLYGGGIGVDFVTYYDQVIRLDYAVNMFFEHGIFLHFTSPF